MLAFGLSLVIGLLICCLLKGFEQQNRIQILANMGVVGLLVCQTRKSLLKKVFAPANSAVVVGGMIMVFLLAAPFRFWPGKQKSAP
jgi:hypothetical protein